MKRYLTIIATLLVLMLTLAACGGTGATTEQETGNADQGADVLKIGAIAPLTGDAAVYGVPVTQSYEIAVEEINAQGGINGKQIELILEDGACGPKLSATAIQKLVNVDKVKFILGGLCSGETLGAAPTANENQVIMISPASTSPDVTNAGNYVFRNIASDAFGSSKVADYATEQGWTKAAIISENTDFAQAQRRVFKEVFAGDIVADETFNTEEADVRTQVTKIKDAEPDVIYLVSQTPQKTGIALESIRLLIPDTPLLGNEFIDTDMIKTQYKEQAEGVVYSVSAFDENTELAKELFDKVLAKYGKISDALSRVYYATSYDAVYILKEAIEASGEDSVAVRDYLHTIENREGTAGALTIDENGDAVMDMAMKTIQNGEAVVIG